MTEPTHGGKLVPPAKFHGGKRYLTRRILALMPRHINFIEPFVGGGQLLFARNPMDPAFWWTDANGRQWKGVNEVVGDIDGDIANFYSTLRDPQTFPEFFRRASLTTFDEKTWKDSRATLSGDGGDRITRAWAFFTCCRLSLAGRMDAFTGMTKVRLRGGRGNEVNAFLKAVEGLPEVHARLRDVQVLHRDAIQVLRKYDVPGSFAYCDPTYDPRTRTAKQVYRHEMTVAQHQDLLNVLLGLRHMKAIVSGYTSPMYDDALAGWRREEVSLANHAAGGKKKRRMVEVLWRNF
jgi:DNA adenine methylase